MHTPIVITMAIPKTEKRIERIEPKFSALIFKRPDIITLKNKSVVSLSGSCQRKARSTYRIIVEHFVSF